MSTWLKDELRRIAETDDLHVSPFREDRKTYGTPTWTWSVVVDDALYVRAYNGQNSRWYKAAMRQKAGRIAGAGMTKEAGNLDHYRVHRGELEPGIQAVKEVRVVLYSSPHAAPILE